MTDDELIEAASKEVAAREGRLVIIEAQLSSCLDLIATVQLALRHPGARRNLAVMRAESFIRDLIEHIDPEHGNIWRLLQMGFDAKHDKRSE